MSKVETVQNKTEGRTRITSIKNKHIKYVKKKKIQKMTTKQFKINVILVIIKKQRNMSQEKTG